MSATLYDLFKNMNLSVGEDSDKLALSWLNKHENVFIGYENGHYLKIDQNVKADCSGYKNISVFDNFNKGKHLCDIYVSSAALPSTNKHFKDAARITSQGFQTWSQLPPVSRSTILYNIAKTIEKYQELFASVEAISSGKHLSKVKAKDVPNLIESFNFYASCAVQIEASWKPIGPVFVITEEYNNPCLNLSLRVSSLLASGCSVLLLADSKSCLSSFLLAEICTQSGLPHGVLNVLPIDSSEPIDCEIPDSDMPAKLIFTGSFKEQFSYHFHNGGDLSVPCEFLFPRRPVVVVYEKADLHSAANSVLEAFFSHDTRSKSGGCKVLIQESISERFLKILKGRFSNVLVGQNLSKTDMSGIVTEQQENILTKCLEEAEKFAKKQTLESQVDDEKWKYHRMMPTLITNLPPNFKLVHEELGGPIIVTVPFRTAKESITMFNCDNKGSPVSIWTEQISVATEVALKLKTGVVWVNSENINDVETPYSGVYLSGNSVEGRKEALFHHMHPGTFSNSNQHAIHEIWSERFKKPDSSVVALSDVKEYKLFIGGAFKLSNNGVIKYKENIYIPSATESDVQSAVSNAVAAQTKWESLTDLQKRKIFFAVIDKLKKAKTEFVSEMQKNLEMYSVDQCEEEIDTALSLLFDLANQEHSLCKTLQETGKNYLVLKKQCPLGVVGIQCPTERPFLSFVTLVFSAIVQGNTTVALCSAEYPTIAFKMCEIFSSANIPSGVINVVCGDYKRLIPALRKNNGVNAFWFTDVSSKFVYDISNPMQQLFSCNEIWSKFDKAERIKCATKCTFTKTIFLPTGDVFAN